MTVAKYLPRFRAAYRALPQFEERESWTRQQIEAFQLDKINAIWTEAIRQVPYYRRLREEHQIPDQFGDLREYTERVPILAKSLVRSSPHDFLTASPHPGSWKRTGGSTGTPMSTYRETRAHREVLMARYRYHAMWDLDIFHKTAYVWGHSATTAPGWRGHVARFRQPLEDRLRNRLRLSAYHLGIPDLRTYLRRLQKFQPESIYGYSQALLLLAREAEKTGFKCPNLKLLTMTGEPSPPHLVEYIESVFKVPTTVEYGSSECGLIAVEWTDRTVRVREDMVFMETIPIGDGSYEIVLTTLNNPSFPLFRYSINDITDAPVQLPERGFAEVQQILGRNNDFVITPSGKNIHSARFDAFFKYSCPSIRCYRIRQDADGALAVSLEMAKATPEEEIRNVERQISELVEGYPVRVELVERIPLTVAGKHRLVVSHVFVPPPHHAAVSSASDTAG